MKKEKRLFGLDMLKGNWESVNLNPTVIIYKNDNAYCLSFIHINETSRQANPSTFEIREDENGYYISYNKRVAVSYDARLDLLNLSEYGNYMRN